MAVKINGQQTIPLGAEVVNNAHFQADTFLVTLEAWQQPDGFGLDFWDQADGGTQIEVLFGILGDGDDVNADPSDQSSLIVGVVDDVEVQLETGDITLTGRDLTGTLIDNKIAQTFPDQTASQIVSTLAGQFGLTPQVTTTTTPTGAYANGSYSSERRDIPVWDYITFLAQTEGFDAYVTGSTLYFGPPQADSSDPIQITVTPPASGSNQVSISTETLKLKRSLTLAKDITVTVISYNATAKQPIKAVAKRQGSAKSGSTSFRTGTTSQNYTIRRASLTQQQAQDLAESILADLTQHERTIEFTAPCDGSLTSRTRTTVSGTNTGWDTDYVIDTVTRRYAFGELTMTATAKNHQIESQPDSE